MGERGRTSGACPSYVVDSCKAAGLRRRGGWADTALPLPELHWRDVFTGVRHAGLRPPMDELTRRLPVALLIPDRVWETELQERADGSIR